MKPRIRIIQEAVDDSDRNNTFSHLYKPISIEDEENYEDIEEDKYPGADDTDGSGDRGNDEFECNYEEEAPVWTFRVVYLGSLSGLFLYILNKFFLYQTAQCIMSMVITVSFLYPLGHIMAKLVPKRRVYLRSLGVEFSLNPGPFDIKEFALISIFANSGAACGGITSHTVHTFNHIKY